MNLRSANAWWLIRSGILADYPRVNADVRCKVAVVGGGITGALVAQRLAGEGTDVVLLDKRDIGQGSTAASTALVQYELDMPLHELAERMGEAPAVRVYQLCRDAICQIDETIRDGQYECGFRRTHGVQLASHSRDVSSLRREHDARQQHGFQTELLSSDDVQARFSFSSPGALWTRDAAQVDPYRLTHQILARGCASGLRVFDRSPVIEYRPTTAGISLVTDRGHRVEADCAIFATGYEAIECMRRRIARLCSTFAVVSDVVDRFDGWHDRCLIWETAKPYHYLRTTDDGRAMIGGGDIRSSDERARNRMIGVKARRLAKHFCSMFPAIPFEPAYAWGGVFAETHDSLPYIGRSPEFKHGLFALGYGANGITFGVIAAEILCALCLHGGHPDAHLFRFDRP